MFIVSIILAVATVVLLLIFASMRKSKNYYTKDAAKGPGIAGAVAAVLAVAALLTSTVYTQGIGEAKVLKSWSGEVVGQDVTPGFDFKSPTTKTVDFDIRNQSASYVGNGEGDNVTGPQITVTDKDGVRDDIDVTVLYSINADKVTDIYREHQNQETFKTRVIEQDIRSVVRTVPGKFSTKTLLNDRAGVEAAISEALTARWAEKGIILESVALQEVRPPADVLARYADAQAAQAQVAKEEALLSAAEVKAQQKIVEATAEAEANNVLTKSLTPEVLAQRQLDTMRAIGENGNLVVVPNGSSPLVQVQK